MDKNINKILQNLNEANSIESLVQRQLRNINKEINNLVKELQKNKKELKDIGYDKDLQGIELIEFLREKVRVALAEWLSSYNTEKTLKSFLELIFDMRVVENKHNQLRVNYIAITDKILREDEVYIDDYALVKRELVKLIGTTLTQKIKNYDTDDESLYEKIRKEDWLWEK